VDPRKGGHLLQLEQIATRTLGDAFERLSEIGRQGRDVCGPGGRYDNTPAIDFEQAQELLDDAREILTYARDHLTYLENRIPDDPEPDQAPEPFERNELVSVTADEDKRLIGHVVKCEQYVDGESAVLVRFDDGHTQPFRLQDVEKVAI